MMAGACEACGWTAAIVSMLAFGSFGAPIKCDAAKSVDIHPLVFQSYKTAMCFLTSWLVLLFGQSFTFSPWGIVSGLFWVPGGVATVYAIKAAGLAVAIGIGSSFIVLVSFTWGIFIFRESVRSVLGACFAVTLMTVGLIGMAYFSSPDAVLPLAVQNDETASTAPTSVPRKGEYEKVTQVQDDEIHVVSLESHHNEPMEIGRGSPKPYEDLRFGDIVDVCGIKISRRTSGILSAMFNGIWGGSIMVPMTWAPPSTGGMGYVISFAIGASLVNLLLWALLFSHYLCKLSSFQEAYRALPSLHLRVMWLAGSVSGTLWSLGNFASMISVQHLGEGVGYSVVQAGMLVSGLWGIFYFREIRASGTILKWFVAATLTVCGILLLSYEHHAAPGE